MSSSVTNEFDLLAVVVELVMVIVLLHVFAVVVVVVIAAVAVAAAVVVVVDVVEGLVSCVVGPLSSFSDAVCILVSSL